MDTLEEYGIRSRQQEHQYIFKILFKNVKLPEGVDDEFLKSVYLDDKKLATVTGYPRSRVRRLRAKLYQACKQTKVDKSFTQLKWYDNGKLTDVVGYVVNKEGIIVKKATRRVVTKYLDSFGYVKTYLNNEKTYFIHVLMNNTYRKLPRELRGLSNREIVVNHLDLNKLNYTLDNLEYTTVLGNNLHAISSGAKAICGEDSNLSKLNAKQVAEIRVSDAPNIVLAGKYKVSTATIRNIRNGKTWNNNCTKRRADG